MATSFLSMGVQCPFYKTDKGAKLVCEGIDEQCNTHHQYKDKKDKERRMRKYCGENYEKCELYKILKKKYE